MNEPALAILLDMDWLFLVGTAAFSVSGYLVGVKKRFDLLGVLIVAILTAIGGGIVRDVLLNRVPVVFRDASPVSVIVATLGLAWLFSLHKSWSAAMHRVFVVADSIGLIAFSLAGAQVGLDHSLNLFGVLCVGFITAVGGGVIRDMMVNDVPFILDRDFYGTVAILMAGLLYLAQAWGWSGTGVTWLLFLLGLVIRLVAHGRDFRLPRV
ncbi:trimeric intracellular cation channel family protein [Chitinimonas sp.]|uniref:trimeric intracellular cation channel family protein n=1 Tax=Chitinimonas sp. TaxID=1934313 RepID=UPI002F93B60B